MRKLKLAAAQIASRRGDILHNLSAHLIAIEAAANYNASFLLFPELSLIGYEPDLASQFALQITDPRLTPLADAARRFKMHIAVGAPIDCGQTKPHLGTIVFGDDGSIKTYAKMHLGGVEGNFFCAGNEHVSIPCGDMKIGLSICADSSQPSHPARLAAEGALAYAASVFLNAEWFATDAPRFPRYAAQHKWLVLMANHGASEGTLASVGNSAAWGPDGRCLAYAQGTDQALVLAEYSDAGWKGEVQPITPMSE